MLDAYHIGFIGGGVMATSESGVVGVMASHDLGILESGCLC